MELIFKKYHISEPHNERIFLVYNPMENSSPFTSDLFRSISHRNFVQNCENILVGPIWEGHQITVKVLNSNGKEIAQNHDTKKIIDAYLKDLGYRDFSFVSESTVKEFGTVYHFAS